MLTKMEKTMLRNDWIDRLFTRLLARYGAQWISMWAGIEPEAIREDWAIELDGLSASALSHGLANLPPDRPPNSAQFRAICLRQVPEPSPALPSPPADPERVAEIVAGLQVPPERDIRDWARELQSREKSGELLTSAQRAMWRTAFLWSEV
jgi:hypothetical protein